MWVGPKDLKWGGDPKDAHLVVSNLTVLPRVSHYRGIKENTK